MNKQEFLKILDEDFDAQLREPTPYCNQIIIDGKVFAEWWPKKGTTMYKGIRGKICSDYEEFLEWLKTLGE